MAIELESGIIRYEGSDNVTREDFNNNWGMVDRRIRRYKKYRSGKDAKGIFTTVDYKRRSDNSLYLRAVLSNPDGNGNYGTLTLTEYGDDGVTVVKTDVITITYDAQGDAVSFE